MIRSLPLLALFFSATVALSQSETTAALLPEDRAVEQAIDHYVDAVLREAKVAPARAADDAEWLRRITLDLVGRIPTMGELSDFIGSTDPVKKAATVDRLMASPGYVRHQAQEFAALLQVQDGRKGPKSGLHDYLLTSVGDKRGWDRMFRDLLTPDESDPKQKGAGDFLKARVKETDRLTIECQLRPMSRSSARARLDAGSFLRHEVVLRPLGRCGRLRRRERFRRRQIHPEQEGRESGAGHVSDGQDH
jgi:hypothetical protein